MINTHLNCLQGLVLQTQRQQNGLQTDKIQSISSSSPPLPSTSPLPHSLNSRQTESCLPSEVKLSHCILLSVYNSVCVWVGGIMSRRGNREESVQPSTLTLREEVCDKVMVGHVPRVELQTLGVMHRQLCPQFRVCEGGCRVRL